ncbi:MAG TPA: preprotein translocase subunit YajC [Gaiellaceae bacterium]|nr:preprotein translocase subunit YajC [Gaiellaceae bacterium]
MGLLIIIILFGAAWLLFLVPARRRRAAHEAMQDSVAAGDEIITAGGIHGTVRQIEDGIAKVEIAPDVVVTLDRRAIAAVATEIEVEPGEDEHDDPAPGTDAEPR